MVTTRFSSAMYPELMSNVSEVLRTIHTHGQTHTQTHKHMHKFIYYQSNVHTGPECPKLLSEDL